MLSVLFFSPHVFVFVFLASWQDSRPTRQQNSNPARQQHSNTAEPQPTQQRQKTLERRKGQKRQPNHPPHKLYGPAECAKRLNPPPPAGVLNGMQTPAQLLQNPRTDPELMQSSHRALQNPEGFNPPYLPLTPRIAPVRASSRQKIVFLFRFSFSAPHF